MGSGDFIGESLQWYIVSLRDADITVQTHLPLVFFISMSKSMFDSDSDSDYELMLSRVAGEVLSGWVDMNFTKMVHSVESAEIDLI